MYPIQVRIFYVHQFTCRMYNVIGAWKIVITRNVNEFESLGLMEMSVECFFFHWILSLFRES